MARIDKFIMHSDFPMPAQVGTASVSVTMPAGTPVGSEVTGTFTIQNSSIFRCAIKSTRLGKTFVGAANAVYKAGDDLYVCAIGVLNPTTAVVRFVNFGSSSTIATETITVNVSSFSLP